VRSFAEYSLDSRLGYPDVFTQAGAIAGPPFPRADSRRNTTVHIAAATLSRRHGYHDTIDWMRAEVSDGRAGERHLDVRILHSIPASATLAMLCRTPSQDVPLSLSNRGTDGLEEVRA
jgi:hypothetical protein